MNNPNALLIIDMQNDLCKDPRRSEKVTAMLPHLLESIELFSDTNGLILYSYFALAHDDEQFRRFGDRYCVAGTPGAEIIDELRPLKGQAIRKEKHSAFYGTELDSILKDSGVKNLFLAGLQTHICILTTAADASFRGYQAIAIQECVLSTREENNQHALDWIAKYVGKVWNISQVRDNLSGDERSHNI